MKLDIHQILQALPHRYPFLLVDRVLELEPGKRISAHQERHRERAVLHGHFPGHPVMPGVLMLEALAQAAAVLSYVRWTSTRTRDAVPISPASTARASSGRSSPATSYDSRSRSTRIKREHLASSTARAGSTASSPVEAELMCALRKREGTGEVPKIHPTAIVDRAAELAGDVEVGAYSVIGPRVEIGAAPRRTARGDRGPHDDRQRQPHLPVRLDRRRAAGQEVRR